jgi:hypothetical protein
MPDSDPFAFHVSPFHLSILAEKQVSPNARLYEHLQDGLACVAYPDCPAAAGDADATMDSVATQVPFTVLIKTTPK